MRLVAFLLLSGITSACSQSPQLSSFIPPEYDMSFDDIGNGKTLIYRNLQNGQESFLDIKVIKKNGIRYRVEKRYNSYSISDSTVIFDGRTVEVYNFFMSGDGRKTKGEKLLDTIITRNKKLGTHITEWKYSTADVLYSTSTEVKFIKDTTMSWDDRKLPCLILQADTDIILQPLNDAANKHLTEVSSTLYFAKAVGIIKFSTEFTDHKGVYNNNSWHLIAIRDIK